MSELGHYTLTGTGLDIIYWILGIIFFLLMVFIFIDLTMESDDRMIQDIKYTKIYWIFILYILPLAFSFGICLESTFLIVECSLEFYYFTRELFSDILLDLGIIFSCLYLISGLFVSGIVKINITE